MNFLRNASLWKFLCLALLFTIASARRIKNNEELHIMMDKIVAMAPAGLAKVYSIGKSANGTSLKVLQLGLTGPNGERPCLAPMVKYVANMHGNEIHGREMLLRFAIDLVKSYSKGLKDIQEFLNNTQVHLLPTMNPDGFNVASSTFHSNRTLWKERGCDKGCVVGRTTLNKVDLNRDFPHLESMGQTRKTLTKDREMETVSLMNWILDNDFILSANYHDGDTVVNFPMDDSMPKGRNVYSPSRDDGLFRRLAMIYAHSSPGQMRSRSFPLGITNGADWYPVSGSMQDFIYIFSSGFDVTVEVSHCKYPYEVSPLPRDWANHRTSMLLFLKQAHTGIKGIVTDRHGKPASGAEIQVKPTGKRLIEGKPVFTSECGEFWRILEPKRRYSIRALGKSGYCSAWHNNIVTNANSVEIVNLKLDVKNPQASPHYVATLRDKKKSIAKCKC